MNYSPLSSRPDYFPTVFTPHSWENVLVQLENVPDGAILCLDDQTLSTAGKISVLWQKIKAFFGFENQTDEVKVGAFLAKFMFQGSAFGHIQKYEDRIQALQNKIETNKLKIHQSVKDFFTISNPDLNELEQKLIDYSNENEQQLMPSFWNRIFSENILVPYNFQFGDTHLTLAENMRDPNQSLNHYQTAAQLCNLQSLTYTQDLAQSFDAFMQQGHYHSQTAAKIELLLAERMFNLSAYEEANRLFEQASNNQNVTFTENQKVLQLNSCLQLHRYDVAAQLSDSIDISDESDSLKRLYAESMTELGDHSSSKVKTLKTKVFRVLTLGATRSASEHAEQSAKFYQMGLSASKQNRDLHQSILDKNLEIAPYLPSINPTQQADSNPSEELIQIYNYLGAMKRSNPLDSPQTQQNIERLTTRILNFYLQNGSDQCLAPIEKALQFIGNIEDRFQMKQSLWSNKSFQSNTPNLVNQRNFFTFDVGASLHFLKAEIRRKAVGDTQEVLKEYKLAVNLTQGGSNPFGAESLYMEDDQAQPDTLVADINAYRELAIKWGTQELKNFVAEQA